MTSSILVFEFMKNFLAIMVMLVFFIKKSYRNYIVPVSRSNTTPPASTIINEAAAMSHVEIPGPSMWYA